MLLTKVLLYIFFLIGSFSRAEPVCSKFHYEERTLEKMIRQEILVEKMKADLEDTKQHVLEALVNLKIERKMFADDIKRETNDIEVLKENMKDTQDHIKSQTEKAIKDYESKMEKLRDCTVTPAIAFKSHVVTDKKLSDNKAIAFTENLLDTLNAYNNQTGVFIAPMAGIYYFSALLCLQIPAHTYFSISLNDIAVSRALFGERERIKCYTMDALTSVEKSDKVSVKCAGSCSGDSLYEDSNMKDSFSGVLLNKQF